MWQLDFAAAPQTLDDIKYELRINEDVLRWLVVKRKALPPLPKPHRMIRAWCEANPELASQLVSSRPQQSFVVAKTEAS